MPHNLRTKIVNSGHCGLLNFWMVHTLKVKACYWLLLLYVIVLLVKRTRNMIDMSNMPIVHILVLHKSLGYILYFCCTAVWLKKDLTIKVPIWECRFLLCGWLKDYKKVGISVALLYDQTKTTQIESRCTNL